MFLKFRAREQGRKRKIFSEGAKSFFLIMIFSQREMFFPVENFHFGRLKTNFSGFEKWKAKKQKQTNKQTKTNK